MATSAVSDQDKKARVARAEIHVPQSARDNYTERIKRDAVARRVSLDEAKSQQLAAWRAEHEADPLAGFGVLADWLQDADLSASFGADPAEVSRAIALQNAKMDPVHEGSALLTDADKAEVVAHRDAVAARSDLRAPVTTEDGAVVPASDVDAVLAGDVTVPAGPGADAPPVEVAPTTSGKSAKSS